jgi:hypothetical protein
MVVEIQHSIEKQFTPRRPFFSLKKKLSFHVLVKYFMQRKRNIWSSGTSLSRSWPEGTPMENKERRH